MRKIVISLAVVALAILFLPSITKAITPATGINLVNVTACQQVGKDIKVTNFGSTYVLKSECRDAGHGMRTYKLTCTSSIQYQVEWQDGCKQIVIPNLIDGDLVKISGESRVWVVGNGKLHEFKSGTIYHDYFSSYINVVTLPPEAITILGIGSPVCYRAGNVVIFPIVPSKIYYTGLNCSLNQVSNEWLAKWYGDDWFKKIINDQNLQLYYEIFNKIGLPFTIDSSPEGSAVKDKNGNVWFVQNGQKRIVTAEGLQANKFQKFLSVDNLNLPTSTLPLEKNEAFLTVQGIFK